MRRTSRKDNRERRPFADDRVDCDRAAVGFDDRSAEREAEPGARRDRAPSRTPGSKMRASSSCGIPRPASEIAISTSSRDAVTRTVTGPPEPACVRAFAMRLSSTCRSRTGSASTRSGCPTPSPTTLAPRTEKATTASCASAAASSGSMRTDVTAMSMTIRSIARAGREREPCELATRQIVGGRASSRLGDRRQRRDGAPHLMHENGESLAVQVRGHSCRSANRPTAQRAASLSIGSSSSTYRANVGPSSTAPTFPAATSALRRSQRASLRGT